MPEEQENPLARGTVGAGGNTNVTNFAYINVTIGDIQITNIPLNDKDYNEQGLKHHAIHDSGFNSYIKSFTCKRQVPKQINSHKGFWQASGGATECNLTIFDPSFVQFENLIMSSVKNQKVHCLVTYGISKGGGGKQPPPFKMHCFINEATENITNAGVEWSLKMSPVPPQWFPDFPEAIDPEGNNVKETVYILGKENNDKNKFNTVSGLVKNLLGKEHWQGLVVTTKKLTKDRKFPTKDYSNIVDFINRKLSPMAECADDAYVSSPYQLVYQLDGSVFFMPVPMTRKQALQLLESGKAEAFGNYKAQQDTTEDMNTKETIESLNMQEYMSEDNGALILKYGFKNSIVQSMSINFDSRSFISQFYFNFYYIDEKNKKQTFKFPEMPKDKDKQDQNAKVITREIKLYATNKDDAMQEAQMITRKLHITNYQGSATLINWPYIGLCQIIKFEHLIPGGSKQSKTESNINKADADVFITNADNPDDKSPVAVNSEAYNNYVRRYGSDQSMSMRKANQKGQSNNKDDIIPEAVNMGEKQKWQAIVESKEYQDELDKVKLKYNNTTPLAGNWEYAGKMKPSKNDNPSSDHFNSNVGVPATLSSWTDSHKSSVGYYVRSITDSIKGGLLTSELELIGWIKWDNPQLDAALKN